MLARQLIADALEAHAATSVGAGAAVLSLEEEEDLAQAVADALFGLGRLERLLEDDSIENINANGADVVWVRHADGSRQRVAPIADSDAELVEVLRSAAARV